MYRHSYTRSCPSHFNETSDSLETSAGKIFPSPIRDSDADCSVNGNGNSSLSQYGSNSRGGEKVRGSSSLQRNQQCGLYIGSTPETALDGGAANLSENKEYRDLPNQNPTLTSQNQLNLLPAGDSPNSHATAPPLQKLNLVSLAESIPDEENFELVVDALTEQFRSLSINMSSEYQTPHAMKQYELVTQFRQKKNKVLKKHFQERYKLEKHTMRFNKKVIQHTQELRKLNRHFMEKYKSLAECFDD